MSSSELKTGLPGPVGNIEVALCQPSDGGILSDHKYCAVVCHPHPLYGGTMDNKVVTTLVRTYLELGVPVARFNFRGVGASEGVHDKGVGEVDDLAAVVAWLKSRVGAEQVLLAGFSFGSAVASHGCLEIPDVAHGVFVAPPVGRYNFSDDKTYPCKICVVMGGRDELVDGDDILRWLESLQPKPEIHCVAEASHFFHGQLVALKELLLMSLSSVARD